MTTQQEIQVVVIDCPNQDALVLEEALGALGLAPSIFSSLETGMSTIYLLADTQEDAEELRETVSQYLKSWTDMISQQPVIESKSMRMEDWANSWKKNFHTFKASKRLVVKPSWEDYSPEVGDIVVPIDPGMCFGTGYHGTTKACLIFLDKLQEKHGKMSFIDAGTGSGILSIGASLLGYGPIEAFDNDPQCITTSLENMAAAGITNIPVECAPLGDFVPKEKADVAAANILAVVLEKQAKDVVALVKPGGYLILAGILTEQYQGILDAFTALGCKELDRMTINEWTSGLYSC